MVGKLGGGAAAFRTRESLGEGSVESFDGKPGDEFLNTQRFFTLKEAQVLMAQWRGFYNTKRPHSSPGYRRPAPEVKSLLEGRLSRRRRGPWNNMESVEYATLEWVDWFNYQRLLEPLGYIPPAEFDTSLLLWSGGFSQDGWTHIEHSPGIPI